MIETREIIKHIYTLKITHIPLSYRFTSALCFLSPLSRSLRDEMVDNRQKGQQAQRNMEHLGDPQLLAMEVPDT